MKILIAPNAFKGSLSALAAATAMQIGALRVIEQNNIQQLPVADGGDGFAQILSEALHLSKSNIVVTGPLNTPITTPIYFSAKQSLAVIEMATICGLALLSPQQRQPHLTTSFGVGEAIKHALDAGVKHIILGIGGSATNDAGLGMTSALGVKFFDSAGNNVKAIGQNLQKIVSIDCSGIDPRLKNTKIEVACDVNNPFYGDKGAAKIFAAQKGANSDQVHQLELGMRQIADVIEKNLNMDINVLAGAGAAGGLGGAMHAFCGATLRPGIDLLLDLIHFDDALEGSSLVLTAEGQFDNQTQYGKAPAGVAKRAKNRNVPCILLAGCVMTKSTNVVDSDFTAIFSICPGPISLEKSLQNAFEYLANCTEQVLRSFVAARN